jgi:hypothetical protein
MVLACPVCSARLDVPDKLAAKLSRKMRCPGCKEVFTVEQGISSERTASAPASAAGDEIADLFGSALRQAAQQETGLAAPAASPASDLWEIDKPDYQGSAFPMQELQDLVKRGWVEKADAIRIQGSPDWIEAGEHPALATAFAVYRKQEAARLTKELSRGGSLMCCNHPDKAAAYLCRDCQKLFCDRCGNESEIRQQPVFLCLECDEPMERLAPASH